MFTFDPERRARLAKGLKRARERSGMTSKEASAELTQRGLPCTLGTLLAWERGTGVTSREPFASDLGLIAELYRCTVESLFADEPAQTKAAT